MAAREPVTLPIRPRWQRRFDPATLWLRCRQTWHGARLLAKWWLRPHTPYQAVFVLATHRCGSNLLVDYVHRLPEVASHSEVLCHTLPFGPHKPRLSPKRALGHIARSLHTLRTPLRGCKLMLDQLANCKLTVDDLEKAFPGAKYLILYRQSLAEQFLSREAAKATQQWVLFDGQERKQARVWINPAELRDYCDRMRRAYRDLIATPWLSERAVLLSYEELTADPAWWLENEICPLLGVPPTAPQTCLRKQNIQPLAERIENYREVAALLASPLCRQHLQWPWQQAKRQAA
jgi:LPS sulfotransferase NodH